MKPPSAALIACGIGENYACAFNGAVVKVSDPNRLLFLGIGADSESEAGTYRKSNERKSDYSFGKTHDFSPF